MKKLIYVIIAFYFTSCNSLIFVWTIKDIIGLIIVVFFALFLTYGSIKEWIEDKSKNRKQ